MKLKICLLGMLCLYFSANAQTTVVPIRLKLGDQMPDVFFHHLMNYKNKSAKISDFKGKLILLDFWDIWCSNCINGFPEMDSLQHAFPDKVQVLLVNCFDDEAQIKILLNRLKSWSIQRVKLPIVYQDTLLRQYFKFHTIPACAWISPGGRVIGFTDREQVTAENIRKVINGENIKLPFRDDYAVKMLYPKPKKP